VSRMIISPSIMPQARNWPSGDQFMSMIFLVIFCWPSWFSPPPPSGLYNILSSSILEDAMLLFNGLMVMQSTGLLCAYLVSASSLFVRMMTYLSFPPTTMRVPSSDTSIHRMLFWVSFFSILTLSSSERRIMNLLSCIKNSYWPDLE